MSFAKGALAKKNLLLIGFMGSGKSRLARELAKETGRFCLDTDALIESREGESVAEIFTHKGEAHFRALEAELALWMERALTESIIATGGGMPLFCDLSSLGRIIYLHLPFETILARLTPEEREKRPLFRDLAKAHALYLEREALYRHIAHDTLEATATPENLAQEILARLSNDHL